MPISILKTLRGRLLKDRTEAEMALKEILDLIEKGEYLQAAMGVRLLYRGLNGLIITAEEKSKKESTKNPQKDE